MADSKESINSINNAFIHRLNLTKKVSAPLSAKTNFSQYNYFNNSRQNSCYTPKEPKKIQKGEELINKQNNQKNTEVLKTEGNFNKRSIKIYQTKIHNSNRNSYKDKKSCSQNKKENVCMNKDVKEYKGQKHNVYRNNSCKSNSRKENPNSIIAERINKFSKEKENNNNKKRVKSSSVNSKNNRLYKDKKLEEKRSNSNSRLGNKMRKSPSCQNNQDNYFDKYIPMVSDNKKNIVQLKVQKELNNIFDNMPEDYEQDPEIHNKFELLLKNIKDIKGFINRRTQTNFKPSKNLAKEQ